MTKDLEVIGNSEPIHTRNWQVKTCICNSTVTWHLVRSIPIDSQTAWNDVPII